MKVLFYVDSAVAFGNSVTTAEMLRRTLSADIVMMIVDSPKFLSRSTESYTVFDSSSLGGFFLPGAFVPVWPKPCTNIKSASTARILRWWLRIMWHLCRPLAKRCIQFIAAAAVRVNWYRSIGRFLDQIKPDLLVLGEENVETLSATFISRGRRRGIPAIIVPFTLPNPLEPAAFYKDSTAHQAKSTAARLLCAMWPKWRFNFEGTELVRLPPRTALLAELLNVSSPAPWILNRGHAAAIVLDSEAQRDQYLELGFPPAQLRVLGDAYGDTLHNALRNKEKLTTAVFEAHGFDLGKPLVLCGFPPDQFSGSNVVDFEFRDYQSLVAGWVSVFRELRDHADFLVRPHPRTTTSQLELLRSHGAEISMEPTVELIGISDVYLASISATIRWAIACGIPVINYDTYRYRYQDFASAGGVFTVETLDDFRRLLRRLLTDRDFRCSAKKKQEMSMQYWGIVDGKTAERFAALVRELVGASEVNRATLAREFPFGVRRRAKFGHMV